MGQKRPFFRPFSCVRPHTVRHCATLCRTATAHPAAHCAREGVEVYIYFPPFARCAARTPHALGPCQRRAHTRQADGRRTAGRTEDNRKLWAGSSANRLRASPLPFAWSWSLDPGAVVAIRTEPGSGRALAPGPRCRIPRHQQQGKHKMLYQGERARVARCERIAQQGERVSVRAIEGSAGRAQPGRGGERRRARAKSFYHTPRPDASGTPLVSPPSRRGTPSRKNARCAPGSRISRGAAPSNPVRRVATRAVRAAWAVRQCERNLSFLA